MYGAPYAGGDLGGKGYGYGGRDRGEGSWALFSYFKCIFQGLC